MDEANLRANRYDLISRIADDLAHEIKNPLNSAVVNLELVRRKAASDPEVAVDRAAIVEDAVGRVHELVLAILGVLRPPSDPAPACAVDSVIDRILPLAAARARLARIQLDVRMDEPGHVAMPDHHLAQLLLNVLDNAMDAAESDGAIRLTAAAPDRVVIRIEDSGPGFPDDVAADAFRAGTSGRGRAGLGLAVCRSLVEAAGGEIVLEADRSELGGSVVRIVLPRPGAA